MLRHSLRAGFHADRHDRRGFPRRSRRRRDLDGGDRLSLRRGERIFPRAGDAGRRRLELCRRAAAATTTARTRRSRRRATMCWSSTATAARRSLLDVFGGKITTYPPARRDGDGEACAALPAARRAAGPPSAPLPGGDFPLRRRSTRSSRALRARYPVPRPAHRAPAGPRLRHARDRDCSAMRAARPISAELSAPGSREREVDYLMRTEWARSAEDILWRRTQARPAHVATPSARAARTLYLETAGHGEPMERLRPRASTRAPPRPAPSSSTTALAPVAHRADASSPQHFPASGWVEHDPEEIWTTTLAVAARGARARPASRPRTSPPSASPTSARRR